MRDVAGRCGVAESTIIEGPNLLRRAGEFGHVIGVTNHGQSRLGRQCGSTVLLRAGTESTVSCKSYLTTLASLHWLGTPLLQGGVPASLAEIHAAERSVRDYLAGWRNHVGELLALTDGIHSVFVTGRGNSLATTGTGGLILKESTRHPAEGMSCTAFRHGPLEMVGQSVFVLVLAGDERVAGLHRRLAEDINCRGGRAAVAATEGASASVFHLPATCPALQPIVEILPVQMLSLALAARDGREAGRFEHASKITVIE
jgi:glutamine---fructose-6-phosphate transaminase (isomerizing)